MQTKAEARGACDHIPLLLTAAIHHPERRVRLEIRRAIQCWVEEADPTFTASEIGGALRAQSGTSIEPFVLNRRDRWIATLLARLAFSSRHEQTRFRVVSREAIGTSGGAMITNHLRSYYIERYAFGHRRRSPEHFGFIAPAAMPSREWITSRKRLTAEAVVDDQGIEIRIGPFHWEREMDVEPRQLAGSLLAHSTIQGPSSMSLSRGFRCTLDGTRLSVRTLSGESMLQLAAHMAQGSVLVLTTTPSDPRARVFVRLKPLEGEVMPLPCVATGTSWTLPKWVKLTVAQGPGVERDVRLAVAKWFRPHDQWMDDDMMEALL